MPESWSPESIDFVNQLIQRKPSSRLGFNGPEELKEHPFLKDTNWKGLLDKTLVPPFIPKPKKALKVKPQTTTEEERAMKEKEEENILLRRHSVQNLFNGFHYDIQIEYKDLIEKDLEDKRLKEAMSKVIKSKDLQTSVEMTTKTDEGLGLYKHA